MGDDSALPAIARRLAELPAGATVFAIVQLPDPVDRRELPSAAAVQLQRVADAAQCLAAVRAAAYWKRGATAHHENLGPASEG